ncbi:MAG TPA: molybdenum cofactor guanylyltransferase [Pyrinomonadaceae bacterium]
MEGFVLAGGKSSRMGTDKAFLKFNGETFLRRAARALSSTCNERVKIVINETQKAKFEKSFASFEYVFDVFYERGALGGIHAALKNSQSVWALILACDLPFVTENAIKNLAEIALNSPEKTAAVVPKQPDGRIQPLCAVYRVRDCLPAIEKILNNENSPPVKDFLKTVPTRLVEVGEFATEGESEILFFNVNRPFDFESIGEKK